MQNSTSRLEARHFTVHATFPLHPPQSLQPESVRSPCGRLLRPRILHWIIVRKARILLPISKPHMMGLCDHAWQLERPLVSTYRNDPRFCSTRMTGLQLLVALLHTSGKEGNCPCQRAGFRCQVKNARGSALIKGLWAPSTPGAAFAHAVSSWAFSCLLKSQFPQPRHSSFHRSRSCN